jgi:hypothetical protein
MTKEEAIALYQRKIGQLYPEDEEQTAKDVIKAIEASSVYQAAMILDKAGWGCPDECAIVLRGKNEKMPEWFDVDHGVELQNQVYELLTKVGKLEAELAQTKAQSEYNYEEMKKALSLVGRLVQVRDAAADVVDAITCAECDYRGYLLIPMSIIWEEVAELRLALKGIQ